MKKKIIWIGLLITVIGILAVSIVIIKSLKGYPENQDIYKYGALELVMNENQELKVVSYDGVTKDVVIPEKLRINWKDYYVKEIESEVFHNSRYLIELEIPNSIESIEKGMLHGCSNLEKISIPFVGGNQKSNTLYPFGHIFGDMTYDFCKRIDQYVCYTNLTRIERKSYFIPISLREITVSAGLINDYAFYGLDIVKKINITSDTLTIGKSSFENCSKLEYVSLGPKITKIGAYAFKNCTSLISVDINSQLEIIEECAFFECRNMIQIKLPQTVKMIGTRAFYCCVNLEQIDLPKYMENIEASAFYACVKLKKIIIPQGITVIKEMTFFNCSELEKIHIPDSVKKIEIYAFHGCKMETIIIPASVQEIEEAAFIGCMYLKNIIIPDGITIMKSEIICHCKSLEWVMIPSSVKNIGNRVFEQCDLLKDIYFGGDYSMWQEIKIGTNNPNLDSCTIHFYSEEKPLDELYSYWHYDNSGKIVLW